MADIKVKRKDNATIKKFDRAEMIGSKIKGNAIKTNERTKELYETNENSGQEYAENKIIDNTKQAVSYGIRKTDKFGKKGLEKTRDNIIKSRQRIKEVKKTAKRVKKAGEKTVKAIRKSIKTMRNTIKTAKKTIKTAERTAKVTIKTTKKVVKTTVKVAQKTAQAVKATVKITIKAIQLAIKVAIAIIKLIIAAAQALVAIIAAGGWVSVLIIVIVVIIALVCTSVFGIFLSNEKEVGSKTMSSVVTEINTEYMNKITKIQKDNPHDEYEINTNRASWKDILSIYGVSVSGGEEQTEVVTLDDKKIDKLKKIFWDMNTITSRTEEIEKDIEYINDDGTIRTEKTNRKILYINVTSKSLEEMMKLYEFTLSQRTQIAELQKAQYNSMWSSVIYGTSVGSTDIVEVALSQLGNKGGEPYWSWYGFSSRVEWCACFVSWCANECGYIDAGIIPKFAGCQAEGVEWFKSCGLWKDGGYIPKTGDIIFFDWADKHDGHSDHVGIVEKVEDDRVYTIEGNSSDSCRQKNYDINDYQIQGYGIPAYE